MADPCPLGTIPFILELGVFGLLGLSWTCPLLALLEYYGRRVWTRSAEPESSDEPGAPKLIEIVIPAHNEAAMIGPTLESVRRCIRFLKTGSGLGAPPRVDVHVGADGCTDGTARIAEKFSEVTVTDFPEKPGKWGTLRTLCMRSAADWIILADAGALWPESFLEDVVRRIAQERNAIAIAPAYRPLKAGWLHRGVWLVETALKSIESRCGGPVSLHGATVCYKAPFLKEAFSRLGDRQWLNDDVVIPLVLRSLHPEGVIRYPVGEVQDAGARLDELDLGRRKRLLLGNLQWIFALLPFCFRSNPVAGMLALRRLFRVFWAYWFAFTGVGLGMTFHALALPEIAVLAILAVTSGKFRQLAGAAAVSLLAPLQIAFPGRRWRESWR